MEIAVVNPQAVLQMYHCKDYPWHSLATSPVADKETIIANTDFTTTSAIARRRLSSKKKRKPGSSSGGSGGGDGAISDGSASSSPTGSLGSLSHHCSPAVVSSTTQQQSSSPALESCLPHRPLSSLPTTHQSTQHTSHTRTYQVVPTHPCATVQPHESAPLIPAAYHLAPTLPVGSGAEHKAFAHPMYSHLQQELNYRYLQEQSGPSSVRHGNGGTAAFSAPQPSNLPQQSSMGVCSTHTAMDASSESRPAHRVKWCSAHVTIAKQIQAHQQQAKNAMEVAHSTGMSRAGAKSNPTGTLDPAQQMALLQMYGVPTTAVPGYMAMPGVPYSMPEVQLRNLSFVPHTAPTALFMDTSNVLSVKPVTGATSQASESSNVNSVMPMVGGVQLLPYTQSLPMAAVMPSGVNSTVHGSYIGPVPVPVIGNCVLNPCQPGVMVAPWVR